MRVDSTPCAAPHLPFANEDDMQGFLEEHAEQLFGLKVIASSSRDGELFEIDVLAVNAANTPFIIEGKWDLVVTAVYGKNPDACYRVPRGKFAEARLCRKKSGSIRWRYCQSGVWKNKEMLAACDAKKIFHRLRQAHVDAG